jgi:hypothetical protein
MTTSMHFRQDAVLGYEPVDRNNVPAIAFACWQVGQGLAAGE